MQRVAILDPTGEVAVVGQPCLSLWEGIGFTFDPCLWLLNASGFSFYAPRWVDAVSKEAGDFQQIMQLRSGAVQAVHRPHGRITKLRLQREARTLRRLKPP